MHEVLVTFLKGTPCKQLQQIKIYQVAMLVYRQKPCFFGAKHTKQVCNAAALMPAVLNILADRHVVGCAIWCTFAEYTIPYTWTHHNSEMQQKAQHLRAQPPSLTDSCKCEKWTLLH